MIDTYQRSVCERALKCWGAEKQLDMMVEEIGEFLDALMKCRRGRTKIGPVVDEIADLQIVLWQMIILFGEEHVAKAIKEKLERTSHKISQVHEKKQDEGT